MSFIGLQRSSLTGSDTFSGDGSTTIFTLSRIALTGNTTTSLAVYISGIAQPASSYTARGFVLTFTSAPPLGHRNIYVIYDSVTPLGTKNITSVRTLGVLNVSSVMNVTTTLHATGSSRFNGNVLAANVVMATISSLTQSHTIVTDRYATFQDALAAATPTGQTIMVTGNTICSANTVVPANVRLKFISQGLITVNTPYTLQVLSPLDVGPRKIFSVRVTNNTSFGNIIFGTAYVTFPGPGARSLPQWFGATGDGITNDTTGFFQGLQALSNGGTFYIPTGKYHLRRGSGAILAPNILSSNITIYGDGPGSYIIGRRENGTMPDDTSNQYYCIFQGANVNNITIRDVGFSGYPVPIAMYECGNTTIQRITGDGSHPGTANNWFTDKGIYLRQCFDTQVRECTMYNYYFNVYLIGPDFRDGTPTTDTKRCDRTVVTGCHFEHTYPANTYSTLFPVGVYPVEANNTIITHNTFKNIYSSVDSGDPNTGVGYGVWQGDGKNGSILCTDNTFIFEGRGLKRSAGIFCGIADGRIKISDNRFVANGGYSQCYYGIGMTLGQGTSSYPGANDRCSIEIDHNLMINDEVLDGFTEGGQSNAGWAVNIDNRGLILTDLHMHDNHISGWWRNALALNLHDFVEGASEASRSNGLSRCTATIDNNFVRGCEGNAFFIVGLNRQEITVQPIIRGNHIIGGNTGGIFLNYTIGGIIENNLIMDGNLSEAYQHQTYGACMILGVTLGATHGYRIVNNIMGNSIPHGPNAPQRQGKFVHGIYHVSEANTRIYKDITYGNEFIGFHDAANTWVRFPAEEPTTSILDIMPGEIIENTRRDLTPNLKGWICTSASFVPLTANVVAADTTFRVADTTGWLANDVILLVRSNTVNFRDSSEAIGVGNAVVQVYYSPSLPTSTYYWHATKIQSVTNSTAIIVTTPPTGDGTYYIPKAHLKRVRFVAI